MNKSKISIIAGLTCILSSALLPTPKAIAQNLGYTSLDDYTEEPLGQVNSVSQLRDVAPGHWAYEAVKQLVERYRCMSGYPDRTFRGNNPVNRYEFAATLNDCLQTIERLIAARESGGVGTPTITRADSSRIQRLVEEFGAELAILTARVDDTEGRTDFLEEHQFSTTTKLVGEVAFTLAQAFGDELDSQVAFSDRVRLQFVTSFKGKDQLFTRLTAGNFNRFLDNNQGRFAFDSPTNNNNVELDRIHYKLPIGDKLQVVAMAGLGSHLAYADTFNGGLEAGGGANNALSRFAERNPIYRLGLGFRTVGVGLRYKFAPQWELSAGYLAPNGSNPAAGSGLFNGNYSALGQLVFKPTDTLKFGFTYSNSYHVSNNAFRFGPTGTGLGNLDNVFTTPGVTSPVSSNSYGIEAQYDISPKFSIRAWGGFTDATFIGLGDAEIWNYALVFAFPDLGKEGNLGAIVVGAEPYLTGLDVPDTSFDNDVPLHLEAFYRYQITDNISLTPGLIWLTSINQTPNNDDGAFIGALRTTFRF